jgi:hypothetical protein
MRTDENTNKNLGEKRVGTILVHLKHFMVHLQTVFFCGGRWDRPGIPGKKYVKVGSRASSGCAASSGELPTTPTAATLRPQRHGR